MGIFDDSGYFGKNDTRSWSEKAAGTRNTTSTNKKVAIAGGNKIPAALRKPSGETSGPIDLGANNPIANIIRRNSSNPTPMRGGDGIPDSLRRPQEPSFIDKIMAQIGGEWGGLDKSKIDYSPLDAALNARISALDNVHNTAQGNFDKSDLNLENMYRANQNDIQTKGAERFNQISDTAKANLQASNDQAVNYLQTIKDQDMAKRNAMLQNLGLTAQSAASPDESADPLNQAIGSIASRTNANITNAEADRGTNLAYNQGIASSVGQQGLERRADLAQQLQGIFGKIDMAKADAQSENAQARYQLEQNAGNQQYQHWRDRQGFLQDTLHQIESDQAAAQKAAADGKNATVGGFAGLPQDLRNSGYQDSDIQNGMNQLADIVASDDYYREANSHSGNNPVTVINRMLQKRGVPPMLAIQIATNYANLGNTSKYEASPY